MLEHTGTLLEHIGTLLEHSGTLLEHTGTLLEHTGTLLGLTGTFSENTQNFAVLPLSRVKFIYTRCLLLDLPIHHIYDSYDIFINCNWVVTRWQYTFTHKQYIDQHK